MNTSDIVPSLIRTYVPVAVGAVASWLAVKGLHVDPSVSVEVTAVLTAGLTAIYYTGVRLVETKYPAIGRILLGLGIKAKPVYVKPVAGPAAPGTPAK